MSEQIIHIQYRDRLEAVPVAQDLDHLGQLVDERVKPGLDELERHADSSITEYLGYAMLYYEFPHQSLAFKFPEFAREFREGLVEIGLAVGDPMTPKPQEQDVHVHFSDCFDMQKLKRAYPSLWRECVYSQEDSSLGSRYSETGNVLGPVVRYDEEQIGRRVDRFNQSTTYDFMIEGAVFIHGWTILQGLYERNPKLIEGWAIRETDPSNLLESKFGLTSKDTTWLDWHLGQQSFENRQIRY